VRAPIAAIGVGVDIDEATGAMDTAPKTLDESPVADDTRNVGASDPIVLSLDAFIRSIGVRRSSPLALFLGAGASTSSGMPSAQMCI
jgi:hypothetical protein